MANDVITNDESQTFVIAEVNTARFMFRGAGRDRAAARAAVLRAWQTHRNVLLSLYPDRTDSIPDETQMEQHFTIYYQEYALDGGYRDGQRLI